MKYADYTQAVNGTNNTSIMTPLRVKQAILANDSGGTGTSNYNDLENKPKINGITLEGDKTSSELGIDEGAIVLEYKDASFLSKIADAKANKKAVLLHYPNKIDQTLTQGGVVATLSTGQYTTFVLSNFKPSGSTPYATYTFTTPTSYVQNGQGVGHAYYEITVDASDSEVLWSTPVQRVLEGVISDLSTIRKNALLGSTALQPQDNISTLTNDKGYITTQEETDPIYSSSAASTITEDDITTWDASEPNVIDTIEVDGTPLTVTDKTVNITGKQDTLVSGTNIKTINSQSLLGSGNIEISGGGIDPSLYNIETRQTLDLTTLLTDNFYPVTWGPTKEFVTLNIRSPQMSDTSSFNQNRLSASVSAMGGSDTPSTVNIYESTQYNADEITIYAICTGNISGVNCVYLRGGLSYTASSNVTLTPHSEAYTTDGGEVFPVIDSSYTPTSEPSHVTLAWDAHLWLGYTNFSNNIYSSSVVGTNLKMNGDADLTISSVDSSAVNFETLYGDKYVFDKSITGNSDIQGYNGFWSRPIGQVETPVGSGNLIIKRANYTEAPNNGVVLEFGNSTIWTGQLFIGDNASQGIYYNGWSDGVRGTWKRLVDEDSLFNKIYPVGSIYLSMSTTNPSTYFGGTWEQLTGRYLYAGISPGATGGSWTSGGHAITTDEMPSHTHSIPNKKTVTSTGNGMLEGWGSGSGTTRTISTGSTGSGSAHTHSIEPPYIHVIVWKRTA